MDERIFWLHISGTGVKNNRNVNAAAYGSYLVNFSKLVNHIILSEGLDPKNYPLFQIGISEGSFVPGLEIQIENYEMDPKDLEQLVSSKMALDQRIEDILEISKNDKGFKRLKETISDSESFGTICRDLIDLSDPPLDGIKAEVYVTDKIVYTGKKSDYFKESLSKSKKTTIAVFSKTQSVYLKKWLDLESKTEGRLLGEFKGCKVNGKDSRLFVELDGGKNVEIPYDEEKFQDQINKLQYRDLVRVKGKYFKPAGRKTKVTIKDFEGIHPIKSEFSLSFEDYLKYFEKEPGFNTEEYQKHLKRLYESYKNNYGIITMLGED